MARRAAKVDDNQSEIVDRFRSHGLKVTSTAGMGKGFPDLIVSHFNKINVLVEVKDSEKPPSRRCLTYDQIIFHEMWHGWIEIIETVEDADNLAEKLINSRIQNIRE